MKKIFLKLGLGCLTVLAVSACNDDFLERYPLDQITNETFWNTENDLAVYNNNLYNLLRNDTAIPILMGHKDGFDSHFSSIWNQDEFSDNMAPASRVTCVFSNYGRASTMYLPTLSGLGTRAGTSFVAST